MDTTCQSCRNPFAIDARDTDFYEKMKVNPPTFCPDCRCRRRLFFRNERTLYKRKCDVTGKDIISIYTPESPHKVCDKEYWYTDAFDSMEYGLEIDWSKPFLEQFRELTLRVPLPSLRVENSVNCEYNSDMSDSSDCYLCSRTHQSKRMLYTYRGNNSSECVDCFQAVKNCEFLYECMECSGCARSQYVYFSEKCTDSAFLYNCKNSIACFMSSNLRNKQYYFMNQQLTKAQYEEAMKTVNLGSAEHILELKKAFSDLVMKTPRKYLTVQNIVDCTGDNILNSKGCHDCYGLKDCENSRYLLDNMFYSDSMDCYSGGKNSELVYEATATSRTSHAVACLRSSDSHDIFYSWFIDNSANIFGCIGLRKKEYCILNRQYSKEEYEELMPKIIAKMNQEGYTDERGRVYRFGEFFPESFSPYAYNETTAQEYFPLSPETVAEHGYRWREPDEKKHVPTIAADALPDSIKETPATIMKEIIGCAHGGNCSHQCTIAFRVTPAELEFYQRMNIPLPRLCPNCRYYERLAYRNPIRLWDRACMCAGDNSENGAYANAITHIHGDVPCPNAFQSSYSPERPEIVYCETCYQQEVV